MTVREKFYMQKVSIHHKFKFYLPKHAEFTYLHTGFQNFFRGHTPGPHVGGWIPPLAPQTSPISPIRGYAPRLKAFSISFVHYRPYWKNQGKVSEFHLAWRVHGYPVFGPELFCPWTTIRHQGELFGAMTIQNLDYSAPTWTIWPLNNSAPGPFGTKVYYSTPGLLHPWTMRHQGGLFGPWTIRPLDYSAPGLFGLLTIQPLDYSAPGPCELFGTRTRG